MDPHHRRVGGRRGRAVAHVELNEIVVLEALGTDQQAEQDRHLLAAFFAVFAVDGPQRHFDLAQRQARIEFQVVQHVLRRIFHALRHRLDQSLLDLVQVPAGVLVRRIAVQDGLQQRQGIGRQRGGVAGVVVDADAAPDEAGVVGLREEALKEGERLGGVLEVPEWFGLQAEVL